MDVIAATEFLARSSTMTSVGWIGYIIIGAIAGWIARRSAHRTRIHPSRCPANRSGSPRRPAQTLVERLVRPLGFEPRTCGLRVRCSAIELEARVQVMDRQHYLPGDRPPKRAASGVRLAKGT